MHKATVMRYELQKKQVLRHSKYTKHPTFYFHRYVHYTPKLPLYEHTIEVINYWNI